MNEYRNEQTNPWMNEINFIENHLGIKWESMMNSVFSGHPNLSPSKTQFAQLTHEVINSIFGG